ncbi:MAG: transcriptional regulator [Anaerocolumna sp.]|jgi:DNA-binding response OmpR family regulator|nr:transcriptional regulator [Anaerocolumna sp.]
MVDLLVIEDNIELGTILCDFLERDGYSLYHGISGEEGIEYLTSNTVKLVLLDIMLPGMDGFGVCKKIREQQNIPIIIMSARTDKHDKLAGLELGADDYIEKPFDMDILLAKIGALLRRNYEFKAKSRIICSNHITIDLDAVCIYYKNEPLVLTTKEFDLLRILVENRGKTLRKEWLFNKVWGMDSFSEPSTLTVHINKLREKIEESPKKPEKIVTVWGVGYKYEEKA